MARPQITLSQTQCAEVETLAALLNQDQIADYLGIARNTFQAICDRDADVLERYERGKAKAIAHVANGLLQKARSGCTTSSIFYLKTQGGWRETNELHHVAPLPDARPTDLSDMSDDELLDYLEITKGLIEAVVKDRAHGTPGASSSRGGCVMRGRKPKPDARAVKVPGRALPRCPPHLDAVARNEWRRLAGPMHAAGVLTIADRGALAAYCQAWSRWVEAEEKLAETPMLLKSPSGYIQQSPWLSISNRQLEIMGRYMAELGLTPVSRARLTHANPPPERTPTRITRVMIAPTQSANVIDGTPETIDATALAGRSASRDGCEK